MCGGPSRPASGPVMTSRTSRLATAPSYCPEPGTGGPGAGRLQHGGLVTDGRVFSLLLRLGAAYASTAANVRAGPAPAVSGCLSPTCLSRTCPRRCTRADGEAGYRCQARRPG